MNEINVYLNVQKIPYKQKNNKQTNKPKTNIKNKTKKKRNLFVFYKAIRVIFPGLN